MDQLKADEPKEVEAIIKCHADRRMFVRNFEDMPQHIQDAFNGELTIPCEGGGVLGTWCEQCVFGEIDVAFQ